MAVDRGGLQYRILIEDAFSAPLDAFVKGIRAAKRELDGLRSTSKGLRATAAGIRDVGRASREAAKDRRELARASTNGERQWLNAIRQVRNAEQAAATARKRAKVEAAERFRLARRLSSENQKLVLAEREVTKIVNKRGQASRVLAAAQQRKIKLTQDEKRANRLLSKEEKELYDVRQRLARLTRAGGGELARINAETEALRRKNRAAKEAAVTELLRRQGLAPSGRTFAEESRRTAARTRSQKAEISRLDRIKKALRGVDAQANRVSFTFRRLFGILAAFAAARAILRAFRNLVKEMVRFNAAIEQSTLGIASLFLAVGDVRDATGAAVDSARGLVLAQKESRRQVQLLRRDALKTAATFEQLLETFQVAIAPGFQAGLDIDQIRKFTLDISRAASAVGLAQNQLAEEIRSILSGVIQARTTRIAVALGITNEDIRNAKEAGILFQFLQERFSAFDEAGEVALKTFNALWTNLIGGFQQVLEAGGLEFFNELKDVLESLQKILVEEDPITGTLTPTKEAVFLTQQFADALQRALQIAREVGESIKFSTLVGATKAIAGGITEAFRVIAALVKGAIQGLADLSRIAGKISETFKGIVGKDIFDNKNLEETVALGTRILTIFLGISAATAIVKLALSGVVVVLGTIVKVTLILNTVLKVVRTTTIGISIAANSIVIPLWVILAAVTLISAGLFLALKTMKEMQEETSGQELKWVSFLKLVKVNAKARFKEIGLVVKRAWNEILISFQGLVSESLEFLTINAIKSIERTLKALALIKPEVRAVAKQVAAFRNVLQRTFIGQQAGLVAQLEEQKRLYEEAKSELDQQLREDTFKVYDDDKTQKTLEEMAKEVLKTVTSGITGLFTDIFDDILPSLEALSGKFELDEAVRDADSLSEAFERVNVIIGQSRKSLEANTELMKELREEAIEVQDAMDLGRVVRGTTGGVTEVLTAVAEARSKIAEDDLKFEKEQQQALLERAGIQNKIFENQKRINALGEKETLLLTTSEILLNRINEISSERSRAVTRQVFQEQLALAKTREGYQEQAEAARTKAGEEAKYVALLGEELDGLRLELDGREKAFNLTEEERKAFRAGLLSRIQLLGEAAVKEEIISKIIRDRLELDRRRQAILNKRLVLLAEEAAFESEQTQKGQRAEIFRQTARQDALNIRGNAAKRAKIAEAEYRAVLLEIEAARTLRDANLEALTKNINERVEALGELQEKLATGGAEAADEARLTAQIKSDEEALVALKEQQNQLQRENNRQKEIELLLIDDAYNREREARRAKDEPIEFGFIKGIEEFVDESLDIFTTWQQTIANSFKALGSTIGKTLTDALTGETSNFQEEFRQFLAKVAEQIITMLVQVAIARSLLGLDTIFGGGLGLGGGGGAAKGGRTEGIKRRKLVLTSPFRKAPGFAYGGLPRLAGEGGGIPPSVSAAVSDIKALRPRGLDPQDKIPIWTAPGEWVVRAKAVKLYGNDIMDAINNMMIDPTALRAIAGINSRGRVTRKVAYSAASGGEITSTSGAPVVNTVPTGGDRPTLAVVAGTEDTMQQLLVGGGPALLDYLRSNRDEFMGEERTIVQ
jgi:hypothetical protein